MYLHDFFSVMWRILSPDVRLSAIYAAPAVPVCQMRLMVRNVSSDMVQNKKTRHVFVP